MNQELISSSPEDKRLEISAIPSKIFPPTRSVTSNDLTSLRISPPSHSKPAPAVLVAQTHNEPVNGKKFWWCPKVKCGAIYDRLQFNDKPRCSQCNSKKVKPPGDYDKMILYQCSIAGCRYREKAVSNSPELSCLHPALGKNPPFCEGWMVPVWEDCWKRFKTKINVMDSVGFI